MQRFDKKGPGKSVRPSACLLFFIMSGLVVFVVFCAREIQKVQRDRAIQLSIGIAIFYDDDDELRHTEAKEVIDKNS